MNDYNLSQKAAIGCTDPRIVCLAGAGSGKTRTLIGRVLHGPCDPRRTALVTFTSNAARVIQERLAAEGKSVAFAGTVHSWMFRLITRYHDLIGLGSRIGILDNEQAQDLLNRLAEQFRYTGTMKDIEAELKHGPREKPDGAAQLLAAAFWDRMMRSNVVDFDSILRLGLKLLGHERVVAEWTVDDLLWDEAQDMGDAHLAIFEAAPAICKFAACDIRQGIYSFLGSNIRNVESIMKNSTVLHLAENYRSDSEIVRVSNAIANAGGDLNDMQPMPQNGTGTVELFDAGDEKKEAMIGARKLNALLAENPQATVAVLVMTHAHRQQLEGFLEGHAVPVEKREDAAPPRDWKLIRAMLAALADVDNEMVCEALVRIWKPTEAEAILQSAVASLMSLNDSTLHLPPYLDRAADAVAYIASKKPSQESLQRLTAAMELSPASDATIADLQLALAEASEKKQVTTAGKVQILTFWAAKGLEFDAVWIPGLEEGLLPTAGAAKSPELLQEQRRVLYVGLTRARSHLFLSWSATRRGLFGGGVQEQKPSRFLCECGDLARRKDKK